jgi:hypothetical protein
MVNLSPTWTEIANKLQKVLSAAGVGKVFYPYPEHAIDPLDLPCVVINEAETLAPEGFAFSAETIRYSGRLSLLVKPIPDNQLRLYGEDINQVTVAALNLYLAVHRSKNLNRMVSNITLGEAPISRLSPNTEGESGADSASYAGMYIPYTVTVQYGSNS